MGSKAMTLWGPINHKVSVCLSFAIAPCKQLPQERPREGVPGEAEARIWVFPASSAITLSEPHMRGQKRICNVTVVYLLFECCLQHLGAVTQAVCVTSSGRDLCSPRHCTLVMDNGFLWGPARPFLPVAPCPPLRVDMTGSSPSLSSVTAPLCGYDSLQFCEGVITPWKELLPSAGCFSGIDFSA